MRCMLLFAILFGCLTTFIGAIDEENQVGAMRMESGLDSEIDESSEVDSADELMADKDVLDSEAMDLMQALMQQPNGVTDTKAKGIKRDIQVVISCRRGLDRISLRRCLRKLARLLEDEDFSI